MEKLLIICEKPSAARNFSKALGGIDGSFNGDEYHIVSLLGHVIALPEPKLVAKSGLTDYIGDFIETKSAPWRFEYFDFDKYVLKEGEACEKSVKECAKYLNKGYIPVIATDIDDFFEGDLIVYEVLKFLNYSGKLYREYHADESKASIIKALTNKKPVTYGNSAFLVAKFRCFGDFLTQCYARVASKTVRDQGYTFPGSIPIGRLKSAIQYLIGRQLELIKAYVPSSLYEYRYRLGDLVLKNDTMERYKTLDELYMSNVDLPDKTLVKQVGSKNGKTPPPKPLKLDKLVSIFANKGVSTDVITKTVQAMYNDSVISYPRTAEDVISKEVFYESLKDVDHYISLLGLPKSLYTHREPRKTHVVETVGHGALKPCSTKVNDLSDLDKYGKHGRDIYKVITESFLKMFLEDTEWIRYDYETETNPVFKGSVKIITKQSLIEEDKTDETLVTVLPDLSQQAELYGHEVKSVRPSMTKISWLLDTLEKHGVGTSATRVSTLNKMLAESDSPIELVSLDKQGNIKEKAKSKTDLILTKKGLLGYASADGTIIGSLDGTKKFQDLLYGLRDGNITVEEAEKEFEEFIKADIITLRDKVYSLEQYGFKRDKIKINWLGKDIYIRNKCGNHVYTLMELSKLEKGEVIEFETTDSRDVPYKVVGKIDYGQNKTTGKEYVEFIGKYTRLDKVTGIWRGKEIQTKNSYGDHVFTNEELKKLFNDEFIIFEMKGNKYKGKLENLEYKGHPYVGVKANILRDDEKYVEGVWKGKQVSISRVISNYEFTEQELQHLFEGKTITVEFKTKKGYMMKKPCRIEEYEYNGKKYIDVRLDFSK